MGDFTVEPMPMKVPVEFTVSTGLLVAFQPQEEAVDYPGAMSGLHSLEGGGVLVAGSVTSEIAELETALSNPGLGGGDKKWIRRRLAELKNKAKRDAAKSKKGKGQHKRARTDNDTKDEQVRAATTGMATVGAGILGYIGYKIVRSAIAGAACGPGALVCATASAILP